MSLKYIEKRDSSYIKDYLARDKINWMKNNILKKDTDTTNYKILDIGCGRGIFVREAGNEGLNCYGTDIRNIYGENKTQFVYRVCSAEEFALIFKKRF